MGATESRTATDDEVLQTVEVWEPGLFTILIATGKRTIAINGCHDAGPTIADEDYTFWPKESAEGF